jgi:hypothetical protein
MYPARHDAPRLGKTRAMSALYIAIAIVALLVILTAVWSWRGGSGTTQLRRRDDVRQRREERDLL